MKLVKSHLLAITITISATILGLSSEAEARPRHHRQSQLTSNEQCTINPNAIQCIGPSSNQNHSERQPYYRTPAGSDAHDISVRSRVIGGRPSGCPHRYCGCGASIYLYGKIIPKLNLARNWSMFPKTSPAPRMAAYRKHHVFVLLSHIQGNTWLVHDSNSGKGLTRIHPRSIAGYTVVNPHVRVASLGQI